MELGVKIGTILLETSDHMWFPPMLHISKIPPLMKDTNIFSVGPKPVPHDRDNT